MTNSHYPLFTTKDSSFSFPNNVVDTQTEPVDLSCVKKIKSKTVKKSDCLIQRQVQNVLMSKYFFK